MDRPTSPLVPHCQDISDPSRRCRSVLGPNCVGSEVYVHRPFDHNRHLPKSGELLCPFPWGKAGSPSIAMSPGPRPASRPSGILICPTLWPQYTNDTRQAHRQT